MTLKPSGRKRPGPPTLQQLKARKVMSKIQLEKVIRERDGATGYRDREKTKVATVRGALLDIVDTPMKDDDQKGVLRRLSNLGNLIADAEETLELSAADRTFILERAEKMIVPALVYGYLLEQLDPQQLVDEAKKTVVPTEQPAAPSEPSA